MRISTIAGAAAAVIAVLTLVSPASATGSTDDAASFSCVAPDAKR